MIVHMKMYGGFMEEAGGLDLIIDFYLNYVDLATQYAAEYKEQNNRISDELLAEWQQQVTRMLINDVQYTSFDAFVQLEK